MRSELKVIFTIDKTFVQHFSVALSSLLENNKDIDFEVFVIHDIEDVTVLDKVVRFAVDKYGVKIELLRIDPAVFESFRTSQHYSKAVYFRLLFTEIIPAYVDKVLFLDSDLVVAGSLNELACFEFKEQSLLAVEDNDQEEHIERLTNMGLPIKKYFNAGVLLINLRKWREQRVADKLIALANKYMEQLSWWDQDILNMYFYDSWEEMDPKFNALHLANELPEMPAIVHYAGPRKPWLYVHETPYKDLYWSYIRLTPFKEAKYPDRTLKQIIIKNYYSVKKTYFPNFKLPAILKNNIKKDSSN